MTSANVKKAATTVFKSYSAARAANEVFPVDCEFIAKGFGIKVVGESLGDDFEACLYISGDVKAIIYNSDVTTTGRVNFTIGHELGHFFLHRKLGDQKCSLTDLENIGSIPPHSMDIEREANLFSATLLMPASDFCNQIRQALPDFKLISSLSKRYHTSLLATLYRLKELSSKPVAILFINEKSKIISVWKNKHFDKLYIPTNSEIDEDISTRSNYTQIDAQRLGIDPDKCEHLLYQSSVDYRFNNLKIMLVTGEPA